MSVNLQKRFCFKSRSNRSQEQSSSGWRYRKRRNSHGMLKEAMRSFCGLAAQNVTQSVPMSKISKQSRC